MKKTSFAATVFLLAGLPLMAQDTTGADRVRLKSEQAQTELTANEQNNPSVQSSASQPAAEQTPLTPSETQPAITTPATAKQPVFIPEPAVGRENSLNTLVGFSIVPRNNWKTGQFVSYQDYLSVDFDETSLTTYEGSIWHKNGLKLGISADVDDNFVGKLNRFMGFLGYKKFMLRVQNGKLRGTANWTGSTYGVMPASTKFDNKYSNIDLLYWTKDASFYWGVGYMSYAMPVQVNGELYSAAKDQIVYGNAVYQANMEYKTYNAMFGFDTMNAATMNGQKGLGFWAYSQDKLGFGKLEVDDTTAQYLSVANGKPIAMQTLTAAVIDYDCTMGLMYTGDLKTVTLSLGLGYNIGGQVAFAFGGGDLIGNKDTQHVRANPFPYLLHHGPVLKAMVKW